MKLVNATGKLPECPSCPNHTSVALMFETRYGNGGKIQLGYWRCPVDNKVYVDESFFKTKL